MKPVVRALALLILVTLPPPGAAADESASDAEARFAREQLLGEARLAVDPSDPVGDDLQAFRETLAADRAALSAYGAGTPLRRTLEETIETRSRLLGRAPASDGPKPDADAPSGALGQARRLHRWLAGLERSSVLVKDLSGDGSAAELPIEWSPVAPAAAEPGVVPPTPDLDAWTAEVKKTAGGTLLRRRIRPAVGGALDALTALDETIPAYLPEQSIERPRRHAVVGDVASAYEANEPFLRVRALQSGERLEAFGRDVPSSGLLDEAIVREKARRAVELREEAVRLRTRRAELLDELNRMALSSADAWKQVLGMLSAQVDDAQRAAGPTGTAEAPAAPQLRVLEAQESTALLDLRLLHLTALRADLRLRLFDRWIALVDAEAQAAEGAQARYVGVLAGHRRERQLAQLEFQRDRKLGRDLASADAWLKEHGASGDPRRVEGVRALRSLIESILAVNAVVLDAVRLRRLALDRLQDGSRAAPATPTAPARPATAEPPARAADPLVGFRTPDTSPLDESYVAAARERLQSPALAGEFDAELIAAHHRAVERRLASLREAVTATAAADDLELRFARADAEARTRLGALPALGMQAYGARHAATLSSHEADFAEAIAGLRADRARIVERVDALAGYRTALREAGSRSFRIRAQQGITTEELARAAEDARRSADAALSWATLQSDPNAFDFAARRWPAVLGCVALAAAGLLCVRRGRRLLDRAIERRMSVDPRSSSAGASPTEEHAQAQANVEMRAAVAKAVEETVLRQAAGDESVAPPPPPPDPLPPSPAVAVPPQPPVGDGA